MSQPNLRSECAAIINDLHDFGMKYVQHRTIGEFFVRLFKPRINNIIMKEAEEQDIKSVLFKVKSRIDNLYKMIDTYEQLQNSPTDKKLNDKIKQLPDFSALKDLLS